MRALFLTLLAISASLFGADTDSLVGTWKLVSWQVIVENEPPRNVFGAHPKGFLVLTRKGRAIVLTTAQDRRPGMGLQAEGNADAAIRFEQLGNDLAKTHEIDILCAYPLSSFHDEEDERVFQSICAEHSAVHSQ